MKEIVKLPEKLKAQNRLKEQTSTVFNKKTKLELRICTLVCEKAMSVSSAEDILDVMKTELPDEQVVQQATLGRTKAGNMIRLGRHI